MQTTQTIVSSPWDQHSWAKHAVYAFKILAMLAVHTPVLVLEIIRFQNLHTLLNSRGYYNSASCIVSGQAAALPGFNEHPERGIKSPETLYIMLLKPRYGLFSV